jgi:hypothetical protein
VSAYILISDSLNIQFFSSKRALAQMGCAYELAQIGTDPKKFNVAVIGSTQSQFSFVKKKIEREFKKATKRDLNIVGMTIPNGSLTHLYYFFNSLNFSKWDLIFFELSPFLFNENNPEFQKGTIMNVPMLEALEAIVFGRGKNFVKHLEIFTRPLDWLQNARPKLSSTQKSECLKENGFKNPDAPEAFTNGPQKPFKLKDDLDKNLKSWYQRFTISKEAMSKLNYLLKNPKLSNKLAFFLPASAELATPYLGKDKKDTFNQLVVKKLEIHSVALLNMNKNYEYSSQLLFRDQIHHNEIGAQLASEIMLEALIQFQKERSFVIERGVLTEIQKKQVEKSLCFPPADWFEEFNQIGNSSSVDFDYLVIGDGRIQDLPSSFLNGKVNFFNRASTHETIATANLKIPYLNVNPDISGVFVQLGIFDLINCKTDLGEVIRQTQILLSRLKNHFPKATIHYIEPFLLNKLPSEGSLTESKKAEQINSDLLIIARRMKAFINERPDKQIKYVTTSKLLADSKTGQLSEKVSNGGFYLNFEGHKRILYALSAHAPTLYKIPRYTFEMAKGSTSNTIYLPSNNQIQENAQSTSATLHFDGEYLEFRFNVFDTQDMPKGKQRDQSVAGGDNVQMIVEMPTTPKKFIEVFVNSNGVVADSYIDPLNPKNQRNNDFHLNPRDIKVSKRTNIWDANIRINLSEYIPDLKKSDSLEFKVNLFRNDFNAQGDTQVYALVPTFSSDHWDLSRMSTINLKTLQ